MITLSQLDPSVTLNQPTKRIPYFSSVWRALPGKTWRMPRLKIVSRPLRTLKNVTMSGIQEAPLFDRPMAAPTTTPRTTPMASQSPMLYSATPSAAPIPIPMAIQAPIARLSLIVRFLLGADHASLRLRDASLPPRAAAPIGEEDAQQEDARHAHEEEKDQVEHEQRREQPHRPVEREDADRDEEQDDGEQDRLGDEASESGTLVRVEILVVANGQAIPRLCWAASGGRIVPYPGGARSGSVGQTAVGDGQPDDARQLHSQKRRVGRRGRQHR